MPLGPIAPLSAAQSVTATVPINQTVGAGTIGASGTGTAAVDSDFGAWLGRALDKVSGAQANADGLAVQAATGDLTAIHDYTIASTEAQLLTQLTVEVRNRAIEAFNDIMRMQV